MAGHRLLQTSHTFYSIYIQDPCKTSTGSHICFLFIWQRWVVNTGTCTILSWFPSIHTFVCPSSAPAHILPLLPSLNVSPIHWVIQIGACQQTCSIHTRPAGIPYSGVPPDIRMDPLPDEYLSPDQGLTGSFSLKVDSCHESTPK